MEMTAELVRERLRSNHLLQPLADAGRPAMLGYSDTDVWVTSGGVTIARFRWRDWWKPGLDTREDHAAAIAYHLAIEAASAGPFDRWLR